MNSACFGQKRYVWMPQGARQYVGLSIMLYVVFGTWSPGMHLLGEDADNATLRRRMRTGVFFEEAAKVKLHDIGVDWPTLNASKSTCQTKKASYKVRNKPSSSGRTSTSRQLHSGKCFASPGFSSPAQMRRLSLLSAFLRRPSAIWRG